MQATCNVKQVFTSVDASWPESVHNLRIWRAYDALNIIRRDGVNAVLPADSGYGAVPCLMVPYRIPQTPQEMPYNRCITKERVIIERYFGQLNQRFSIPQHTVRLSSEKIPKLIICYFVLHNIAKYLQDPEPEYQNLVKILLLQKMTIKMQLQEILDIREKLGGIN